MEVPKPTEADKEYFRSVLPDNPEVEVKPMFGNLGAFVHGNMFAGLFGAAVGVRLADADRDELAAVDGAGPFGPAERPMGGYLSLPPTWRADPDLAADWVGRALSHVSEMPAKPPRSSKARAKSRTPRDH
jgi:TfoX/Sxy family transcriptional regulator of competence genes